MALASLVDDLCLNVYKGHDSLLLLLELFAVFDTIDQGIHLEAELNIKECPRDWFKLFLRLRKLP